MAVLNIGWRAARRVRDRMWACEATVAGAILALLYADVAALDPERSLAQLHHTAWTAEDDAPSQISALAQTTDGYLWIGSARGLFRFDGVEFERYIPPDSVSLPAHNIYALLATPDGGLWISFRPSGLGFIKDGHFTSFTRPEEIPSSQVYDLACDHDGRVWAATHDGLVLREGSRWVPIGTDWNLPRSRIQTLLVDREGTLWAAVDERLHSLRRGAKSFVASDTSVGWVVDITQASDGRLWLTQDATLGKPRIAVHGSGANEFSIAGFANETIVDRDGSLWIAAYASGLRRINVSRPLETREISQDDPRIDAFRETDGLSANTVHALLEDREGNIWTGTAKGLDRFRHNHFVPVPLAEGHQAFTLMAGEQGQVWVGSATGEPLLRIHDDRIETLDLEMQISSACRGSDGTLWWGAFNGIACQKSDTFVQYSQPEGYTPEWIWEIFRSDIPGALWVSYGDFGLLHFKNGTWEKRPAPVGLPDRGPSASYHAPDGRIWLGYTENRVCILDGTQVQAFTQADGIDVGRIRVIRGRGPHYWLGGELGLTVFRDGRFRTVASTEGEPFGTVSGIVETADGSIWLNEMRGVVRIASDEVQRLLRDPTHAANYQRFDHRNGLPGAGQMNWTCSTAIEASEGRLWFATDNGLGWIDPQRIQTNVLRPPVVVRSISVDAERFDAASNPRLPQRTSRLRIDYTALSLSIPEQVRFRFRLEGYDEDWRDAGTRRTAFYTGLRPGSFRFHVVAANNDGAWNPEGAAVAFSIAPAFYQTTWFATCCVLAVAGALWLFYLVRVRQVAARLQRLHDERVDERTRIAHELHDTLLQGFLSASMQLHVATEAIPAESPAKTQVRRVLGLMDQVIGDARNAVLGLRGDGADTTPELEQALARIQQELASADGVDFRVVVNGRQRRLQPVVRDEVYRIGRESVVNAFRHAQAQTIEAELHYLAGELRVVVRDDGRGIAPEVLRAGRDGHWGLTGMRERAKGLGARLTVRSRVGSGTEIELVVPGRIAFVDGSSPGWFNRLKERRGARTRAVASEE